MMSPACDVRIRFPITCGVRTRCGPSSSTSNACLRPSERPTPDSNRSSSGIPEAVPTAKLYRDGRVAPSREPDIRIRKRGASGWPRSGRDLEGLVDEGEQPALGHVSDHLAHGLPAR